VAEVVIGDVIANQPTDRHANFFVLRTRYRQYLWVSLHQFHAVMAVECGELVGTQQRRNGDRCGIRGHDRPSCESVSV